jgi:protein SCO1/2
MLAAGAAALVGTTADPLLGSGAAMADPRHDRLPNVEVIDQDGNAFRFYDDLVRDRVVLLNFFFTSCGETCPLVTQNLREVQDILGERIGRDIFMYSVSLQPELETPAILKDYAQLWDVRPGWKFLTGAPADIEALRQATGFASSNPAEDRIKDNHTGIVRYGNDRLDRWAGTAGLGRPAWIAKAVSALLVTA